MEIAEIRLANLKAQLAVHNSTGKKDKEFAAQCGVSAQQLYQLKTGLRDMGNTIARRIEKNLKLPKGYFDTAHGASEVRDQLANYDVESGRKCIIVADDGMHPMIMVDDEVWYEPDVLPATGKLGVINAAGRVMVREYRENWADDRMVGIWCAVNDRYADIPADKVELLGRTSRIVRDTQ